MPITALPGTFDPCKRSIGRWPTRQGKVLRLDRGIPFQGRIARNRPQTGAGLLGTSENCYNRPQVRGSSGECRLITLTFFPSTPGVAEATAGGFPAILAAPGQLLLKDLVLLAASLSLCICTGPVAQRSEVMRWKSLVYRSHLRRRACRREASIGCRPTTARNHAAPGLIGSAEPL